MSKFKDFLQSNDKRNEMRQIEQEEQIIIQFKEQREKMEILKIEFLKKENQIKEMQTHIEQLQADCEQLREVYQESVQTAEREIFKSHQLEIEKESLLKDVNEMQETILQLNQENTMNHQQIQQSQQQEQMILLAEENARLKTEIAKLDELLFATEPLKEENKKLKDKLQEFQSEKLKLAKELKYSKQQINKQIEEFQAIVVKDLSSEIHSLQEYKESYQIMKAQLQETERTCLELKNENDELQQEIRHFYEKEESDIKIKSELDRVRQDLMSVRSQETERLNEIVNGMLSIGSLVNSREYYN